jgi:SAM-dependent methyltransferase
MLTPGQLDRAKSLRWYHCYDFGDVQTVGRSANLRPNQTLYGVFDMLNGIDVGGMAVLEVGPAHGIVSVGLAMRGAKVTACDIGGRKPPQIELCEEIFGVEIDHRVLLPLEKTPDHFAPGAFDLIVCAGVMYHLINPADVFFRLRPLLKRNGLFVMETVYAKHKDPVVVLNSETGEIGQPTTYFLASRSAVEGMAKLASFDVLATRINSPRRFSMTARAVTPDEVRDRSEMCRKIHDYGRFEDPMFPTAGFADTPASTIDYTGETGHAIIDTKTYVPQFPPCPVAVENPIGADFHGIR